jgi:hypothetical protein
MQDDHQLIAWVKNYVTNDEQPTDDAMRRRFVHLSDQARTQELQSLTSWFRDDSTLRQKAQIMKIGRELNQIHMGLRKLGR